MINSALVVVDAQNDFIYGELGTQEAIEAVTNICKVIEDFNGDVMIFTKDHHKSSDDITIESMKVPIHCRKFTPGALIEDRIKHSIVASCLSSKQKYILKSTFCALKGWPRLRKCKEITIVGFCTDICVISNALYLRSKCPKARITVVENACAGTTPEKHAAALEIMKSNLIDVISLT